MASILGFTLKGIRTFRGRDWDGVQGSIYYKGKKVGWYNDSGDGGAADIDFEGTIEERRKMDELLKAAAVEYYKRYPMTGIYADLPIDSELFMSALVGIIDDEKEYKKAVKGGYTKLIVYTDPKTRFQMLAKFPTTESMEKYIAEKGITVERKYEKIEDFTIE
jgi:hypothetical protein